MERRLYKIEKYFKRRKLLEIAARGRVLHRIQVARPTLLLERKDFKDDSFMVSYYSYRSSYLY